MIKWMSVSKMPGIAVAGGLAGLAVASLCWVGQAEAREYEIGSIEAFEAALFDPFLLTADPFLLPVTRSPSPDEVLPVAAPAPRAPSPRGAPAAAPAPSVGSTYIPPIRVPYRPPLRSPSRPPIGP